MLGWREEAAGPAEGFNKLPPMGIEPYHFLGNLGLTGGTAYFGLLRVAAAKEGDIVFVSAAAGAVGSAVVQIAKAKGMTVIGSAGGADKCAWVRELGADAAIDYKAGSVLEQLREAAPKGIDVYFDNVGGDHLDAALATARQNARFAICGMIEEYNTSPGKPLRYITRIIAARIMLKGFIYLDFLGELGEFYREMGGWIAAGKLTSRETIRDGIEAAPASLPRPVQRRQYRQDAGPALADPDPALRRRREPRRIVADAVAEHGADVADVLDPRRGIAAAPRSGPLPCRPRPCRCGRRCRGRSRRSGSRSGSPRAA